MCIGSWLGNRRKRDHWGELGVDGWFILGWMCGEKPVYSSFVGNPEGKKPLGRTRRRWVDNIRMDLQDVRCVYMNWIGLAQDRESWRTLVSEVIKIWVP